MKHSVRKILSDLIRNFNPDKVITSMEDGDHSIVLYGSFGPLTFDMAVILCRNNITKPSNYNTFYVFECTSRSELLEVVNSELRDLTTEILKSKFTKYIYESRYTIHGRDH